APIRSLLNPSRILDESVAVTRRDVTHTSRVAIHHRQEVTTLSIDLFHISILPAVNRYAMLTTTGSPEGRDELARRIEIRRGDALQHGWSIDKAPQRRFIEPGLMRKIGASR